jgi:hypothetical protein
MSFSLFCEFYEVRNNLNFTVIGLLTHIKTKCEMGEKEIFKLSDKNIIPTDDYIFSILGEKKKHWQSIMSYISENYNDAAGAWNYYNDGKQWLFKMVRKKKTIFWGGIFEDTFRITFYFGDKAEPLIETSDLPANIKEGFRVAKRYGAIRAISIKVFEHSDVENVLKLILIKNKIK